MKWVDRVAAVNVDDLENYYNVLGIYEDKEKVFEDSHNVLIKFINFIAGIGGGFLNTPEL